MARTKRSHGQKKSNGATLGFEAKLWAAADALRNNAVHIFWVPKEARWSHLKANAKQPTIGVLVDEAMVAIERDNPSLKGVLPKDYARPGLDKQRLGQLIDLTSNIGLGDPENRSKDILGRVYDYSLAQFASAEGKKGGQFYTPRCVVRLLVEMLAAYRGRVYDPCCGSGGMFVQSEKFVEEHGGKIGQISLYGQESNYTTWRLCKMNLAIRGIDGNITHGDSFHNDQHPDLKADFLLANPPFNDSDWRGEQLRGDKHWGYGAPPTGKANFAWVQHFIHHLAPMGLAGFVLANGSMSSNQSGEGEIRRAIIESDLVDCMVALPGQLFYSTQIPVCLWFITRDKKNGPTCAAGAVGRHFRDRRGKVLFIDARKLGRMIDRVHRELTDEDIRRIADTYHSWRGDSSRSPLPTVGEGQGEGAYRDVPGFCKTATLADIRGHSHVLTPGRYVGAEAAEDDGEPFEEKMQRLTAQLAAQMAESARLQEAKLSSEIENIVTTQDELFRAALDEASVTDPQTKEVIRYRTALRRGYEVLIHKLKNLEAFLLAVDGADPLIRMAIAHYQFEAIHPFTDGNGRSGRILNILYLLHARLLRIPVLTLSRYIIQNTADYYRLLRGVTEAGEWEPWLLYMLRGIEETAKRN